MPINTSSHRYVVFNPPDAFTVLNPITSVGRAHNASTTASSGPRSAASGFSTSAGAANTASITATPTPTTSDPPTPSAIAGMSSTPFRNWDWTGATPLSPGWSIVNGDDTPNNEKSASKPSNVTVESEAGTSGGVYLRLATRREVTFGQPFSGVQMENFSFGYGGGQPFYVEVRLRWTGYEGCWPGPWMIMYPAYPQSEIDIMETPNTRQPWTTLHPYGWNDPQTHVGAQYAAFNDGGWHRYGLRVDRTGVYRYFDNVHVSSYLNATHASLFVDANMGLKFQHFCGGNWPDDDLGLPRGTTPRANVPFPNYFDCDYFRIYR